MEDIVLDKVNEYKDAKRALVKAIRASKRAAWKALCAKLEEDTWGQGYRIVVKHLKGMGQSYAITQERKRQIVESLFPTRNDSWEVEGRAENVPPFTEEELEVAALRIKPGTAPGTDDILPEVLKDAVDRCPSSFLSVFNNLLSEQRFPEMWKTARVILIPKGVGPQTDDTKYRPICLISVLGKLYEALIRDRLTRELEETQGIAEHQYGFRRGRSTIDAALRVTRRQAAKWVVLVTIDVKNAFNSASWGVTMEKLKDRNISLYLRNVVGDYFSDRAIVVGRDKIAASAGVPQVVERVIRRFVKNSPSIWSRANLLRR